MRRYRAIAGMAALTAVSLLAAACSNSSSHSAAPPKPSELSSLSGPVSGHVSYESWTPTADEMKQVDAGLQKQDPGITVTPQLLPYANYLTSLKSELASGSGPDVFVLPPGAYLNEFKNFIEPIGPYASASLGKNWQAQFLPQAQSAFVVDGTPLGMPTRPMSVGGILWVNKTMLDKYHLPVPTNYDQLKQDGQVLKSHGIATIAFGGKDEFQLIDYYLTMANDIDKTATAAAYNGTGKWTATPLVQAFADFKQVFSDGLVQSGALGAMTYNDTYNMWLNQQAAFFANGSWNTDMYVNSAAKIAKLNPVIIPFPTPNAVSPGNVVGDVSGVIVINKKAKDKAAAYKLVEYMSHGGGDQILANSFLDPGTTVNPLQPTVKLTANATAVRAQISQLLNGGHLAGGRNIPDATVQDALSQALQRLLAGNTDPQGAANQVQSAVGS